MDRFQGFEIIGKISEIETFAVGTSIREIERLCDQYGRGRWRKCKGIAICLLADGSVIEAEIHWYEAHGIGRKEEKIKKVIQW